MVTAEWFLEGKIVDPRGMVFQMSVSETMFLHAGSTVLGEIVERDTSGCDPPTVSPVQASLSSFPEVMDRRSSKVYCLFVYKICSQHHIYTKIPDSSMAVQTMNKGYAICSLH